MSVMKPAPPSSRYAVFGAGPHLVGVPASVVEEIFVLPAIHHSPGLPPHWRGVANVRGSALPALDLRICLGLVSASSDLEALLTLLRDREQDHRNWLSELEASVRERRKFTLATDPRKCKFGQWYYAFTACSRTCCSSSSRSGGRSRTSTARSGSRRSWAGGGA